MEKNLIFSLLLSVIIFESVCGITPSLEHNLIKPENFGNSTTSTTECFELEKGNITKRDSIMEDQEDDSPDFTDDPETMENDSQGNAIEDSNEPEQEEELSWNQENNGFANSEFRTFTPMPKNFGRMKSFQKTNWEPEEDAFLERPLKQQNIYSDFREATERNRNRRPFFNGQNLSRNKINNYNHPLPLGNQMHVRYNPNPSIDFTFDKVQEHRRENKPIVINLKTECQACQHHHPGKSYSIPKHDLVPKSHFFSHNHAKHHPNHHQYHHNSLISPIHHIPFTTISQSSSLLTPNHHNSVIASSNSNSYNNPLMSNSKHNSLASATSHLPTISSFHTIPIYCR